MTNADIQAVVIGASAGGVEALSVILPRLPSSFSLPVVVAIHMPSDRESVMARVLDERCAIPVCEAEDKMVVEGGQVYVTPPDYHLLIEKDRHFSLSNEEPVNYSRPSIDVLFETAADAYGKHLLGIVLTGANVDGAQGSRAICQTGGTLLVQDPATANSRCMPQAALQACTDARVMSLQEIAEFLREIGTDP